MTPDIERFLDLATRPLEASPGEREEAKGELMSRIGHSGVPYEMLDLREPLAALEASAPAKPIRRRSLLASAAALLTIAVIAASAYLAWQFLLMSQANTLSARARYSSIYAVKKNHEHILKHIRTVAPDLPLGLHPEAGSSGETSSALATNPDDLAMLQEHILRRMRENHQWTGFTDEEREPMDRLDPENALWQLIQIRPFLAKATGSTSSWSGYISTGSTIISALDFEQALRLFSKAASKSTYIDRSSSLERRQLDAFRPARSLHDSMIETAFSRFASQPFEQSPGSLEILAQYHTERLISASDKEGLVKFYSEWKQLLKVIASSPEPLVNSYGGIYYQLKEMGKLMEDAFDQLGMAAEKAEVAAKVKALDHLSSHSLLLPDEIRQASGMRLKSESRLPRDLTVEEALPSRRVDLLFFDRIITTAFSCLALAFAGLVAFEACRRSRIVKGMARGLMPLFRLQDHAWIAGLGLILPWTWWFIISRISPLGWRDGDLDVGWPALIVPIQSAAGFILAAVLLLQTARWRWSLRGGFIGLGVTLPWIGWGVAALIAISIPAAGSLRYFETSLNVDQKGFFMLAVSGMAACGLLWLLWQGVMTLFTPRSGALRPNLTMRSALPWAMVGVVTLLASIAISTMLERHWFARDPLFPAVTSKTHANALKERLAKEFREAIRDL